MVVAVHKGSYGLMWQTISRVYAGWIVPERIFLRDDAIIQVYLNNPKNTAEAELTTALYFPVDLNRTFRTATPAENH